MFNQIGMAGWLAGCYGVVEVREVLGSSEPSFFLKKHATNLSTQHYSRREAEFIAD